ncbi:MAG: hypothetical protein ABFS10_09335 [Bacteroidota bacterium]
MIFLNVNAQEGDTGREEHHPRHQLAAGFGFTFIPVAGGLGDTEARGLFVPQIGLDYFYHIHGRWGGGLMADYELDHYMIVEQQIEREHALLLILAGEFKITEHWAVFAGGGVEIEPHDHLGVVRLGAEYSIVLKKNWVLLPMLYFDFKENYDTWSFAVSIGKRF